MCKFNIHSISAEQISYTNETNTYFLFMYFLYFFRRNLLDGRPRFFVTNSPSLGPVLDDGSLFSESDWLTPGSAWVPLAKGVVPLPSPEELASSDPGVSTLPLALDTPSASVQIKTLKHHK